MQLESTLPEYSQQQNYFKKERIVKQLQVLIHCRTKGGRLCFIDIFSYFYIKDEFSVSRQHINIFLKGFVITIIFL